jgi:hypothetical protein
LSGIDSTAERGKRRGATSPAMKNVRKPSPGRAPQSLGGVPVQALLRLSGVVFQHLARHGIGRIGHGDLGRCGADRLRAIGHAGAGAQKIYSAGR